METERRGEQILYELLWWLFTIIVAILILLPIYINVPQFPFFAANFVYIVVAITLTRYMFLLNISWLRNHIYLQAAISLALIPLIFWMGQYFNYFIVYFDEHGPDVLVDHLLRNTAVLMDNYIHAEYRFFGVWAIIASLVAPFRLLYNAWNRYRGVGVTRR